MHLGEAYMLKMDKWFSFRNHLGNLNRQQFPFDGLLKKHRKYVKKWKEVKQLEVHKDNKCLTLAAFATADRYDLESVLNALKTQDRYMACELTDDQPMGTALCNAVHLKSKSLNGAEDSHVFCFDVGTVVMWNLTHGQREEMLCFLQPFEQHPYGFSLSRSSSELLAYKYAKSRASYLYDNTLFFGVLEKNPTMIGINRFLISCAISLSTKVAAFENMIESHLCCMEKTAARIKLGKDMDIKQKEILTIAGVAYMTKHNLKQSTDSLLLPCELLQHFKSDDERESFVNTCIYFSLPQRLELFDNNLVLCECYVNLLLNHFSYRQNARFQNIVLATIGIAGITLLYKLFKNNSF